MNKTKISYTEGTNTGFATGLANGLITWKDTPDDISFICDGKERLRLCENGDFMVKGKIIANDKLLYDAFKEWLSGVINERDKFCEKFTARENKPISFGFTGKCPHCIEQVKNLSECGTSWGENLYVCPKCNKNIITDISGRVKKVRKNVKKD